MSSIKDALKFFEEMEGAWAENKRTALAMVMSVQGSAYRRPGAKMMLADDGYMSGTISGGCLENDIYGWAEKAIQHNTPHVQTYNLSEDAMWGLGIGCRGIIDVLILPIEAADGFWKKTHAMLKNDQPLAIVLELPTGIRSGLQGDISWGEAMPPNVLSLVQKQLKRSTRTTVYESKGRKYVIDILLPAESLIVSGAGHDAVPVVRLASSVGFSVTVLDPRKASNHSQRFETADNHLISEPGDVNVLDVQNTNWVIMNHNKSRDGMALDLAIRSQAKWIGVLGPLERTRDMLRKIGHTFDRSKIYAPVGLDLGAETTDEVAVSIVAQLMAIRRNRSAQSLQGKEKIH